MCGISGVIGLENQKINSSIINKMIDKIKYRGPDDDGLYVSDNIGLGFVRLSIIDLSEAGHQPMFDASNRYVIIHNGEVYNFLELREELIEKGYSFKSKTDTEVILNSYIEWGEKCLDKFNGMWAFAIYDTMDNEIFFSRDRFGIKPFYYFQKKGYFIFASEIRPILSAIKELGLEDDVDANYQMIFDYLVFNRTDHTNQTFFNNIFKLEHGNFIRIKLDNKNTIKNSVSFNKWYDISDAVKKAIPFTDSKQFKQSFLSSIGLRLRSDVPIGVCLSGGLDSSSIVSCLVNDHNLHNLNTFSAIYNKGDYGDESDFINEFEKELNNMHFTFPTGESLYLDLDKFVRAHSEPVPSTSPYAQFKVMELAKDNVVVTLDGQGADEILAGYHYFYGFYFKELIGKYKFLKLTTEIYHYLKIHKSLLGLKSLVYFMLPDFMKTNVRSNQTFYILRKFADKYKNSNNVTKNIYNSKTLNGALIDHVNHKLEHLLKWEDRNSMFFSLESRVPFLDHNLVEKTIASTSEIKINKGMTKQVLRHSMTGILPEKIRNRVDKIGFGTPAKKWFIDKKFKDCFYDLYQSGNKIKDIVDIKKIDDIFYKHQSGEKDYSKEIWKIINLSLWFNIFKNYIK